MKCMSLYNFYLSIEQEILTIFFQNMHRSCRNFNKIKFASETIFSMLFIYSTVMTSWQFKNVSKELAKYKPDLWISAFWFEHQKIWKIQMASMYGKYGKEDAILIHFLKIICSNHKHQMHTMSRPKKYSFIHCLYSKK